MPEVPRHLNKTAKNGKAKTTCRQQKGGDAKKGRVLKKKDQKAACPKSARWDSYQSRVGDSERTHSYVL